MPLRTTSPASPFRSFRPTTSPIIEEMRKLQKKGVKIITVDGDVNRREFRDARRYYIGTDNIVAGRDARHGDQGDSRSAKASSKAAMCNTPASPKTTTPAAAWTASKKRSATHTPKTTACPMDESHASQENVRNAIRTIRTWSHIVGIWAYNAPAIAQVVDEPRSA